MIRTYSELIKIPDFIGRFKYLELNGVVGELNQEVNRYLNQYFYHTAEWRHLRNEILARDGGYDLGILDRPIYGRPIIHHLNPITVKDVLDRSPEILDPENLILVSHETHNAIHYGSEDLLLPDSIPERIPGDTKLW